MSEKYTICELAKTNPSEAFKQAIALVEVFEAENTALKQQLAEAVNYFEQIRGSYTCGIEEDHRFCKPNRLSEQFLQSLKAKEIKE